jgi:hypothetical protein
MYVLKEHKIIDDEVSDLPCLILNDVLIYLHTLFKLKKMYDKRIPPPTHSIPTNKVEVFQTDILQRKSLNRGLVLEVLLAAIFM